MRYCQVRFNKLWVGIPIVYLSPVKKLKRRVNISKRELAHMTNKSNKSKRENWGGSRPNSGRIRLNYRLDNETAKLLRLLTQYLALKNPDVVYTPDLVLDALIQQAVHSNMISEKE